MKKTFTLLIICLLALPTFSYGQELSRQQERYARKDARREEKRLEEEGYSVFPGDAPIRRQLEHQYLKRYATDEKGAPIYLLASATSVAGTEIAATRQALKAAKNLLAGQLSAKVNEIVEQRVATQQMSRKEATTITQTMANSKTLVSQQIGQIAVTSKFYRRLEDNQLEVSVTIAYSQEMADKYLKQFYRRRLEEESDRLGDELDQMMQDN